MFMRKGNPGDVQRHIVRASYRVINTLVCGGRVWVCVCGGGVNTNVPPEPT